MEKPCINKVILSYLILLIFDSTNPYIYMTKGPVIIYRLGGGGGAAEDLGGIIWLSEGLRGGSAVIDRRKGGIRPKKKEF